jgi:hypothetical protein
MMRDGTPFYQEDCAEQVVQRGKELAIDRLPDCGDQRRIGIIFGGNGTPAAFDYPPHLRATL